MGTAQHSLHCVLTVPRSGARAADDAHWRAARATLRPFRLMGNSVEFLMRVTTYEIAMTLDISHSTYNNLANNNIT